MRSRTLVGLLVVAACHRAGPSDDPPVAGAAGGAAEVVARDAAFDGVVARIEARRVELAHAYAAVDRSGRGAIRDEARAFLRGAIRDELFPAWLGMPWGLGRNSTATRPHQPGMTVGCSYFVTAILGNAGVLLDNRYRFAQAPALDIQRSLAPEQIHRYLSIPARDLERRIAALGDGLYLIGLSNHIAFVDVSGGAVHLVHASWSGDRQVADEPFVTARAIDVSRKAGYFVSPVLSDTVVDAWLAGSELAFRPSG